MLLIFSETVVKEKIPSQLQIYRINGVVAGHSIKNISSKRVRVVQLLKMTNFVEHLKNKHFNQMRELVETKN